jgi:hypothetical protein
MLKKAVAGLAIFFILGASAITPPEKTIWVPNESGPFELHQLLLTSASDKALVDAFRQLARAEGQADGEGRGRTSRHCGEALFKVFTELHRRGSATEAKLLPLLQDANGDVRLEAASYVQTFAPPATIAALEGLVKHPVRVWKSQGRTLPSYGTIRAKYLLTRARRAPSGFNPSPKPPKPPMRPVRAVPKELHRLANSEILAMIAVHHLSSLGPQLLRGLTPSIEMVRTVPGKGPLPLGGSRIGGLPDLPGGVAWPARRGRHLALMAQLDLAALRPADWRNELPASGHLYFFYDADRQNSDQSKPEAGGAVVFDNGTHALLRAQRPADLVPGLVFVSTPIVFRTSLTLSDDPPIAPPGSRTDENAFLAFKHELDARQHPDHGWSPETIHQLLGWSHPQQDAMEPQLAGAQGRSSDWRLLAEFNSDKETFGDLWGDEGLVYFWIRKTDLKLRRFERTVILEQGG